MLTLSSIKKYDKFLKETTGKARQDFPGYERYELAQNGSLYLWSLGAYPSIIKNYVEPFEIC